MYQALLFCNDLKLGHYIHIAPRHVFIGQIWAVIINTFVSAAIFNFQMIEFAPFACQNGSSNAFRRLPWHLHAGRPIQAHLPWAQDILHRSRVLGSTGT